VAVVTVAVFAGRVEGQLAWESPTLYSPGGPAGFGIHLMEPWPSSEIGVMGTFRSAPIPSGLGFRLGLGEGPGPDDDDLAVFGGVDLGGTVMTATGEVPIDVLWMTGAGFGVGNDDFVLTFPLGLSVGARLDAEGATFVPYTVPRVVLDACLGDDEERFPNRFCGGDEDLDLDLAVDIGVDIVFSPPWVIRFAASLGDRDAILIGLNFPY
jgi:hypothetical protein